MAPAMSGSTSARGRWRKSCPTAARCSSLMVVMTADHNRMSERAASSGQRAGEAACPRSPPRCLLLAARLLGLLFLSRQPLHALPAQEAVGGPAARGRGAVLELARRRRPAGRRQPDRRDVLSGRLPLRASPYTNRDQPAFPPASDRGVVRHAR